MLTTLCYILIKWLIFKGFNGTDDLHYGMLAARMIRGEYDPFQPGDIFSGRILLIASQAAIYKVAGINIISTQAGSTIVLMLSCYLTVCRLLPVKDVAGTFIACCLFYFNPVITSLTASIGGDIYILLAGVLICILLKGWIYGRKSVTRNVITGSGLAFIIAMCLLYKETMIVFLPFVCVIAFLYGKAYANFLVFSAIIMFSLMIMLYAFIYYHYTGDPFFKLLQISNSSYPNHCSYDLLPVRELVVRLTYGVYQEFITAGFYPVIFAAVAAVFHIQKKGILLSEQYMFTVFFVVLLLISLYFPFSFHGYQPLCSDARQFLFLLPLGVVSTTGFISNYNEEKRGKYGFILGLIIILAACICSTGNKWEWMIYLFICSCFVLSVLVKRLARLLLAIAFPAVLWFSILEHLFFKNSNWFYDMQMLDKRIVSKYYYFPDHDNMMHWELLHHFDQKNFVFYNLYSHPFKVFNIYYQHPRKEIFNPGWFILNRAYNVRPPGLVEKLDSLDKPDPFIKKITSGDMTAYHIDNAARLSYIQSLIWSYK